MKMCGKINIAILFTLFLTVQLSHVKVRYVRNWKKPRLVTRHMKGERALAFGKHIFDCLTRTSH
ncbi:hypothetical protein RHGRI_036795 [Rhododendron griersonianum]|uniref:Secreted protein n=1 Tax=Rhododendron griersonianum TaxID=479676 RepID=A0AAV6HS88_9ERIC|nr:hypothetical protein RHGRI_036795 [Rhododendron griersonianum]